MKKTAKRTVKSNDIILPKKTNKGGSARTSVRSNSTSKSAPKKSAPVKKTPTKKAPKSNLSIFERFSNWRRMRKEKEIRKRAEAKASLPKEPIKRFFAHFSPKRVFRYWFSWYGFKKFLKFCFACFLLVIIFIGGLFLYYKKDLQEIHLSNLEISETVNTYLDRNGKVLWEDTGDSDYRLVVDGSDIALSMRHATVAIEDKNFYSHPGIDLMALVRATFATLSGKGVQGGSTLTQQLIKQVYFSDEAASENRGGLTRKIKELILAIELEKMYDKEQIITMYLNESPYGGRRNGVESASQTYFGKSAKDLTLAESALLAAIPNNPGVLNPYNEYGNEALIERQHKVLDSMQEMNYATKEEVEEAKSVDILSTIKPESSQYAGIKAPHFVLEVKSQLEEKYGIQTMRAGGFTIKTTLDYDAQLLAEQAVATGAGMMAANGSDNIALASVDVETSQVIAMVGSVNFNATGYGEVNAATSPLEPGSSIKPLLDYTPLFMQREGRNYGPGSILRDENIDSLYCSGYRGACRLRNYTGRFYGNVTIRQALANSLNIGAVKALHINGIENSLEILHKLGDKTYCEESGSAGGLSIAIGSGCNVRPVEHANAYASIARGGSYKPLSYILEVKNSSGDVLESWTDTKGEQVVDQQVAYMISSILSDAGARSMVFGSQGRAFGFVIPGVWTATKTGTTTTSNSAVTKDSWIASYSTALSTVVWNGNHDGRGLKNSTNNLVRRVVNNYMQAVHPNVYAKQGKWSSGDQPSQPAGIHKETVNGKSDIWPSWYNSKTSGVEKVTLVFNKFTYTLASDCTLESAKISIEATKTVDPITKNEVWYVPDPYNREVSDSCSYVAPTVALSRDGDKLKVTITPGSVNLASYSLTVDGVLKESGVIPTNVFNMNYTVLGTETSASVTITDAAGVSASASLTF